MISFHKVSICRSSSIDPNRTDVYSNPFFWYRIQIPTSTWGTENRKVNRGRSTYMIVSILLGSRRGLCRISISTQTMWYCDKVCSKQSCNRFLNIRRPWRSPGKVVVTSEHGFFCEVEKQEGIHIAAEDLPTCEKIHLIYLYTAKIML